jgi:hypothetical protein
LERIQYKQQNNLYIYIHKSPSDVIQYILNPIFISRSLKKDRFGAKTIFSVVIHRPLEHELVTITDAQMASLLTN